MNTEELSIKLTEIDQRCKSNTHRISQLEQDTKALNELTTAVKVMVNTQGHLAEKMDGIDGKVDALDGKVTALECKPAKRWDSLVEKVIWAVVAALVGFLLAQLGL